MVSGRPFVLWISCWTRQVQFGSVQRLLALFEADAILSVVLYFAGHLQCCDQTKPFPGAPTALFLECSALWSHTLREVLQRCIRPQGEGQVRSEMYKSKRPFSLVPLYTGILFYIAIIHEWLLKINITRQLSRNPKIPCQTWVRNLVQKTLIHMGASSYLFTSFGWMGLWDYVSIQYMVVEEKDKQCWKNNAYY